MHDLCYKFSTASDILHETLVDIVGILAINHQLNVKPKLKDPGEALAKVLDALNKTADLKNSAPSLAKQFNKERIFATPSVVKTTIIIAALDTTLLVEIILRVDGFLTNRNTRVLKDKCTGRTHNKNTTCCQKNSKNCTSNNRKIYCNTCKICISCSKLLPKLERCGILVLRESIDTIRSLRNLLSHATDKHFENLENNAEPFFDFKHCTTWYKMWSIYYETLDDCLSYLCSENFITKTEQGDRLVKMQKVRNTSSMQDLQEQFNDYFTKMSNFFDHALHSLPTKTDLDQVKFDIIDRTEVIIEEKLDSVYQKLTCGKGKESKYILYIYQAQYIHFYQIINTGTHVYYIVHAVVSMIIALLQYV